MGSFFYLLIAYLVFLQLSVAIQKKKKKGKSIIPAAWEQILGIKTEKPGFSPALETSSKAGMFS